MRYGLATVAGKTRTVNADALFTSTFSVHSFGLHQSGDLFIVVDGMGDNKSGRLAAAIAIQEISQSILSHLALPEFMHINDDYIQQLMRTSFQAAHTQLQFRFEFIAGAVATAALVIANKIYIAHIGDTRAYALTTAGYTQLTTDHTMDSMSIIDSFNPNPPNPWSYNVLYRALGQSEEIEVYVYPFSEGDYLLLCSDGLHRQVPDAEMQRIVLEYQIPQQACDQLIALVLQREGSDDASVIVVQL